MDFSLNEQQQSVRQAIRDLLVEQEGTTEADATLLPRLIKANLIRGLKSGSDVLEASFVAEEVSRHCRLVPAGLHALVGPLLPKLPEEPIAIRRVESASPIRFATVARLLIILEDDRACVFKVDSRNMQPVQSNYVYPVACASATGEPMAILDANLVQRRWQLTIAAEIVGAMDAAMEQLVAYLTQRRQFGRSLASFQSLQHRLSELAVSVECSRILMREAAWQDEDELAASAACYAARAARQVCLEAHQLSGARGFTHEFGLHRATLRLQLLSLEAGGMSRHASVAAMKRWSAGPRLTVSEIAERNGAGSLAAPV